MSRTPEHYNRPDLREPPVPVSIVANRDIDEAVEWCQNKLGLKRITKRYLREQTNIGELRCQIIAGRRAYSTAALWEFVMTRPTHTQNRKTNILPAPHDIHAGRI